MAFVKTIVMHTFPGDFYLMQNYIHLVLLYALFLSLFIVCFILSLYFSLGLIVKPSLVIGHCFNVFLPVFFPYYLFNLNFLFIYCISLSLTHILSLSSFHLQIPFRFFYIHFCSHYAIFCSLSHLHSISFPAFISTVIFGVYLTQLSSFFFNFSLLFSVN